tara:strand:- start:540 stop:1739 length:1200 start_codon:yes stop_codon:yes gene_type:complete
MSLKNALETAKEILEMESMTMGVEAEMDTKSVKKKKAGGKDTEVSADADGKGEKTADGVTPQVAEPTGKMQPKPDMKPSAAKSEVVDDLDKMDKSEEEMYGSEEEMYGSEEEYMSKPEEEMYGSEEEYRDMNGNIVKTGMEGGTKKMRMRKMKMREHLGTLFSGEELSEEFKDKASTVFEAAVDMRVEEIRKELSEEFEATLDEEKEALATKLDEYLSYVVENWMKENQVAVDAGIKTDISESFMVGLKALFEEHYVTMPDAKYDLVEGLNNKIDDVEAKLNESIEKNIELSKGLVKAQCEALYESTSRDMTSTDEEKFRSMVEAIDFNSVDDFQEKLNTLKENFFESEETVVTPLVEEFATDEAEAEREHTLDLSPSMTAYTTMLKKVNNSAKQNKQS